MFYNNQDIHTIDNCRFCYMCRHICPVGMATCREIDNARGRAIVLSMVNRGVEYTEDIADAMYNCALCGACTSQCVTGFDPTGFIKAARAESLAKTIAPADAVELINRIIKTGSPYEQIEDAELNMEIQSLPKESDILLFLGHTARYKTPANAVAAVRVLKKAGLKFSVMRDEPNCGNTLAELTGPTQEAQKAVANAAYAINSTGAKTIVSLSPHATKMFLREYKEWGAPLSATVRTFTDMVAELIKDGKLLPRKSEKIVTYHDPCRLARDLEETEEARFILSRCATVKEMHLRGSQTCCCGGLLDLYRPGLSIDMAKSRCENAKNTGAEILITACPGCTNSLSKADMMPVKSLEQFLLEILDG